ncbi:MAG: hypothetical protein HRT90_01235 [Candidatus Margulisbacteria bacterium]|nr:hypothetical protein [Candidatus Margulisiibacteriota bacterium]
MAHEDRIIDMVGAGGADQIEENPYHKKIKKEISQKHQQKEQKKNSVKMDLKDKVQLSQPFKWRESKKGSFELEETPQEKEYTRLKHSGTKVLQILGLKIDLAERKDVLMESYKKVFIETKSHNWLFAKLYQLKAGVMQFLLSRLGLTPKELDTLRKEATEGAFEDNKKKFAQNEYNSELFGIFSAGREKKKLKAFNEVRGQLMKQMINLGKKSVYTKTSVLSIQLDQVTKIYDDLREEKKNLIFKRDYYAHG